MFMGPRGGEGDIGLDGLGQLRRARSPRKRRAAAICVACVGALALCPPGQAAITRSGTFHAVVTDNFRTGQSTTRYTLQSGKRRTVVRPTELAAEAGDRVVVTGRMDEGRLVGAVEATGPSTQSVVPGSRKVAVLLITFAGDPAEPWPPEQTRAQVFTAADSANAFYQEESYGAISLTGKLSPSGDVFGWFRLDTPTAGCPYGTWREEADEAAAKAGIDLTGYQHLIYKFPYNGNCSWFGVASGNGNWSMNNGDFGVQVIAHELGHNLGLLHAGSWTCTSGGVRVQISDDCTVAQYGDPFDVMGSIATRHSNSWNLAKLGFIGPGNVETVDATGTYLMRSALHPTTEPTTLRVPRAKFPGGYVYSWYYLEVREKGGIFENVSDASTTGVSIRATEEVSPETLLLDANPVTATFQDAPLGVGQTFNGGSVRIKTLSVSGGSATVSIELDEEPPSAPTALTVTGGLEEALLQWDASTDEFGVARYRVFRDGSEIGTAPGTTFIDDPAPVGDHEYVVYAEDATGNLSAASDPATATIEADLDPPTAPTNLTATVGDEGVQLEWGASIDNVGVESYRALRDGIQIGFTNSVEIFDPFAPGGAQTYVVYAVDEAGNMSDPSAPVTVTVPAIAGPVCSAGSCQVTFRYSGSEATWTVPAGVSGPKFTVAGARGGGVGFNLGAQVVATLGSLTAGESVTVSVGGKGKTYVQGGEGGFNGGGDGGLGGGGGGFSSVALGSTLMLLAGGGGGEGADGFNAVTEAALGGGEGGEGGKSATAGSGGGGATGVHGATLGAGGGGAAGGSGGSGGSGGAVTGTSTCPGSASAGTAGAAGGSFSGGGGVAGGGGGGGGGGGYVGGGQGGGGASDACGSTAGSGGGGGGFSFAAPGLSAKFNDGARLNDGQVLVAYSNPVSAVSRNYFTERNQVLAVDSASGILSAASGPSGVPLSTSVASPTAHGSLVLSDDGSFTYTPNAGYTGTDSFAYRAADPSGDYATAQVSLRIAAPPSASISTPLTGGTYAIGQSVPTGFSCTEGAGGTGLLSCGDSSGTKAAGKGTGHLDTSTLGAHTYTVTAVSKDGLESSTSIAYTVVLAPEPRLPLRPQLPPNPPDHSPGSPEEPRPPEINLALNVETESLDELRQTGKLVLVMKVNKAAKVALTGRAIGVPTRRRARARPVAVFNGKTIGFSGPGEKEVALVLTQNGRDLLRNLTKLRLAISGSAIDDALGGRVKRTVALSLR
jgi:Bacterial Ig domain/Gametolysin peptidase M11